MYLSRARVLFAARLIAALVGLASSGFAHCEWHYDKQAIMGTEVHLQFWHEDGEQAAAITAAVMGEFRRIDAALSPYKESSELSRVNRVAGQGPIVVSSELASIVDKSLWYSDKTRGAFDITYATVGSLYDFRAGERADQKTTDTLLPAVNYRHIQLDRKKHTMGFTDPRTKIDLGGIAKGYAVDRAVAILKQHGVQNASVSAGGDARLLGDKRGKPWLIGIRHPRQKSKNAAVIPLEDTAISTSGDYERFFIDDDNHRVHHIFNPATGMPAATDSSGDATDSNKLISVSVIGPNGFDTDPLSTSVFVLGKEKGMALIEELTGFEAVVIDANHRMFFTSGLQQ
ncbi:FAD:protein FMN transferase [Microbulbifer hydrolyticus]|uniref:FAD:protein FMN transferase n=1 Tax=Microbulbifer hydrolyticus TaxID=48074 RepID=A0A6P1T7U0_9GAMM|nr:FAD:protein FMN transferase [Microbulbifer hydrolyticus]MBB5211529.1 thiamine biosynthesis lipoprotein [Microbulbifer hydrolyticus]QHQ37730.1 FAD:protein FMN transferase [Microbulbifer hydrolyticus]